MSQILIDFSLLKIQHIVCCIHNANQYLQRGCLRTRIAKAKICYY